MSARILVVDDEPDLEALIRQKFRRQIRGGEFTFEFACDGVEALEMLAADPGFDMVLSDINMPRMDGLTLLERLRELDEDIKTVIVSAYGDMANIRVAMNRGAFDFITKPIDFDDLETTVRKALRGRSAVRELHLKRETAERERSNLSRYFSPNLVEQIAREPDTLHPEGRWRELSYLCTDLTGFTPLVESSEPAVIVPLLNDYLGGLTGIVFEYDGTLDKIVGDAVHAMFGAPLEQPDHADRAIACAMAMDTFSEEFRREKASEGTVLGATRIGVHSGPAIVGNFGGHMFFDYTAHGDAISTATRLEHVNKLFGTRICVSAESLDKAADFKGRPIGSMWLPGRAAPIELFEPLDSETFDTAPMQAYRDAFEKLRRDDPSARQAFASIVGEYGDDPLATYHLRRLLSGESGVVITTGDGGPDRAGATRAQETPS